MNNNAIGFFDSGVGGLTTLIETRRLMPCENYLYYADTLHAPFGNLDETNIFEYTKSGVEYLYNRGVKAVVLACNTATKVCAKSLREKYAYSLPILGLEPAIKPAQKNRARTLVLTTQATAKSDSFLSLLAKYGENMYVMPMPSLALDIENNIDSLIAVAKSLKIDFNLYDSLVLGCTHYILLKDILMHLHPHLTIFDGNSGLADNLQNTLTVKCMLTNFESLGEIEIVTTGRGKQLYYSLINDFGKFTKICQ